MVDKCNYKYKPVDPRIYDDDDDDAREKICKQLNATTLSDANLTQYISEVANVFCTDNQTDVTGYDAKLTEKLVAHLLLQIEEMNETTVKQDLHNMFVGLKRCWTKHHLCFAELSHNTTSYIRNNISLFEFPTVFNETLKILQLHYHALIKNLQEKSKLINKIRQQYIGDSNCKALMYSITAPVIEEAMYIQYLVATYGDMMLDWYIRHALLFRYDNYTDARSIYHTVFTTKIMARTFQFASSCQTVVIALFRYVAICMPFSASQFCTYRDAVAACLFSFASSVLLHVPHYVLIANDYNDTAKILFMTDNETSLSGNNFNSFFSGYHVFFYNVIMFFSLPFLLLTFFNVRLVQELYLHSSTISSDTTRESENRDVTKAVVAVVLVYVITYVPVPIYIIDKWFFKNSFHLVMVKLDCFCFFWINFIVWSFPSINSSVNFFIYYLFRKTFKEKVHDIFSQIKCCVRKKIPPSPHHTDGFNPQ